jgi:peptide/nickel transport system substrate-binding protein
MQFATSHRGRALVGCAVLVVAALFVTLASGVARADRSAGPPQVVRVGWPERVKTLDLARTTDILPMMVVHLIGGTLMNFNATSTGVVPGLAAKTSVSSGGKKYTFTLRPHLRFSDGTPLTAKDVRATFDAQRKDKANSNAADFAQWTSVSAPAANKVVITLKGPQPSLPSLLAAPWHAVFPASAVAKGASFWNKPVSAGPFRVQSLSGGGATVNLAANPYYWGPKPAIPKFVFSDVEDENTRIIQLKAKQIDVAGELSPSSIPQLSGGGVSGEVVRQFGAYYIWMSNRKQPLSDVNVRKAISYAVDRDQINKLVWSGKNKPLGGLFPSTMSEHVNNIPIKQDIAKAKSLLVGTQCASGCTVKIMVRNGRPVDQKNAVIIQQNLKLIGIDVQIENVDNSVASQREASGDFDMEGEWLGLPLDIPDTYMNYAVLSNGGINALFSGYHSAAMDAAVNKAKASSGAARAAAIAEVNRLFARDLPYVPLNDAATVLGWNASVKPYMKYGPNGLFDVKGK